MNAQLNSQTVSNRNTKLDSVKAVLIFGVVLAHTLQSREPGLLNTINMVVKTFLLSFLMPLFIIISGYFFNTKCSKEKLFKKVIEILATFLVFQFIRLVLAGKYSIVDLLSTQYTLWYLLCLVYWRVAVYFLAKRFSIGTVLCLSIIISLGAGFIPTNILTFQRACSFFPFFVFGCYCRTHNILYKIDKIRASLSFVTLLMAIIICILAELYGEIDLAHVFKGTILYTNYTDMVIRGGWLVISLVISLCIYRLIPDRTMFAKYGGCTLVIYLLHSFFTQQFGKLINHHILYNDLITCMVFSLVVFLFCAYLSRFRIIKILTQPITFK